MYWTTTARLNPQIPLSHIPIKKQPKHPSSTILFHLATTTFPFRLWSRPNPNPIPLTITPIPKRVRRNSENPSIRHLSHGLAQLVPADPAHRGYSLHRLSKRSLPLRELTCVQDFRLHRPVAYVHVAIFPLLDPEHVIQADLEH